MQSIPNSKKTLNFRKNRSIVDKIASVHIFVVQSLEWGSPVQETLYWLWESVWEYEQRDTVEVAEALLIIQKIRHLIQCTR